MRLADGTLWPMPITLDVKEAFAEKVEIGQDIALRDQEGVILATMTVTDKWTRQGARGRKVFGADDDGASGGELPAQRGRPVYLGGPSPASSSRCITISAAGATRRTSCAPISASWAGARSSPSRRATRCTARTRN